MGQQVKLISKHKLLNECVVKADFKRLCTNIVNQFKPEAK